MIEKKDEVKEEIKEEKKNVKPVSPAVQQMIFTDLGNYGGIHTGIDKLYYLMNVIYKLSSHLMVNYGKEWFYNEIEKELKNTPLKYKSFQEIDKSFSKIKPKLNKIKIYYDDIRSRKEIPKEKKIKLSSLVKKISPYDLEIYFMFNILMKISSLQRHTIPRQYFRTAETKDYVKTPFDKAKPLTEENLVREEEGEKR